MFDNSNEIEKIFSAKLHEKLLSEGEKTLELDRLVLLKDIPKEGQPMHDFMLLNKEFKKLKAERINKFQKIQVVYIDVTSGFKGFRKVVVEIDDFRKSIKASYNINDVIKLDPIVLGTRRTSSFDSSYETIKNKINP